MLERRYGSAYRRFRDWEATEERLRSLVPKALEVLEKVLANEADPKLSANVALAVLRAAGLYGLEQPSKPRRLLLDLGIDPDLEAQLSGEAH